PSGNTNRYCSTAGALTSGHIVEFDSNGNCVDSGLANARSYAVQVLNSSSAIGDTPIPDIVAPGHNSQWSINVSARVTRPASSGSLVVRCGGSPAIIDGTALSASIIGAVGACSTTMSLVSGEH